MNIYLFFALFLAAGILSAAGLALLRRRLPFGQYNWPLCLFLAVLGAAANNTAAVFFAGGDAFLPSGGFFGGGNLTALVTGLFLALFAVPGILTSLFFLQKPAKMGPAAGWVWGYVLTQGAVSCAVLLLGLWPGYAAIPLILYVPLAALLLLLVSLGLGYRWGGSGILGRNLALGGGGALAALSLALTAGMRAQAHIDPAWGLDLTQTPCGLWYTRLNLPAAVLLGDYQYDWEITAPLLYLSAIAPAVLFTAGWLAGRHFNTVFQRNGSLRYRARA